MHMAGFLLEGGHSATEAVTKMSCQSLLYQPDPQSCGLTFWGGGGEGRRELKLFQVISFQTSLLFLLICSL